MNEPKIPPVMRLLMEEDWGDLRSFEDFSRKYKKIAREIAAQAEYGYENHDYYDQRSPGERAFLVTAGGGLNPFSNDVCSAPACRVKAANEFAATLGLYADVITLPDPLSRDLADDRKPTPQKIGRVLTHMLVLRELYPLIEAGVVRFWSGRLALCDGCYREAERQIDDGVSELSEQLDKYLHVELRPDHLILKTTGLLESPVSMYCPLRSKDKAKLESGMSAEQLGKVKAIDWIRDGVQRSLFELAYSRRMSSILFSTSRNELYALKRFDKDAPSLSSLAVWEKARSIQLPWVNRLSPNQILQLRNDADRALPSFRETFVSHIVSPSATTESVENRIEKLRESAVEVERELLALNPSSEQHFRNIVGALGITVSVYGFASGFAAPAVALGGLMSLLGLIHASARHDDQKLAQLIAQPGYVLLRAKELAEHA